MRSRSSGGGGRSHSSSSSSSSFSSGRSHSSFSSSRSHMSSMSRSPSPRYHNGPGHMGPRPSHMHSRHYVGRPHMHHTSVHISGPTGAIFAIILLFATFYILPLIISFSSVNSSIDTITTSYHYYQDMIDYAKQNSAYQMKGVVKGIYQDSNYDNAWYLKYTVYNPNYSFQVYVTDYTFSVYSTSDITNIKLGDEIMIAVDSPTPPILDSIDMNYGNVELDDDPEYQYYIQKRANLRRTFTIYGIVVGSIFVIAISIAIKAAIKKSKNLDSNTTTTSSESTITTINDKPKIRYCEYCGVALENGESKCKVCGARNDKQ